ncbi:glycosyl hydrolase [Tetragenococcus halophilus subsp. flandriensis]|uniref:glycoside hydrolase family 125 protein n=1 Tax=Tetragenococcus halophilus TaxID=51669 RepID=UPI0023EA2BE8|nr:glycoside hydrolase family 125 protein [Tetragenococcus halophilus]GMA08801.1 glycosyl hydrolase [Tetragenococcus halophilus subsp. flandriensis]
MIDQKYLIDKITSFADTVTLYSEKATKLFRHALIDTISNTVSVQNDGNIFVATGDIPAMWLRDSTFQVLPYLQLTDEIPELKDLLHGVIKQQLSFIQHDPYANAFNKSANGAHYSQDQSNIPISDWVWERKFEIDSLCAPLYLSFLLYEKTGYKEHLTEEFWKTVDKILDVFITEQHHEDSDYYFKRTDCPPSDTLKNNGRGAPVQYTGMVWSGFRPSDDACVYGYFIPGNLFIVSVLKKLLTIIPECYTAIEEKMSTLLIEIKKGVQDFGQMTVEGETVYAYEVDGFGKQLFMDDANVPSLLSLPFLRFCAADEPLYLSTRKQVLSRNNPFYYEGKYLAGVGSPHTPENHVWPIALAMEGLTTQNIEKIKTKIDLICATDANTNQCHEGVFVDDPNQYTREWFSWSNMTFCQLIFHYLSLSREE